MAYKRILLTLVAVTLLAAACSGGSGADDPAAASAETAQAPQSNDADPPPEALAFAEETPLSVNCAAVNEYVLTPLDEDDFEAVLDALDRLQPLVGEGRPDVASTLSQIKDLYQDASPNDADLDVALDTLMSYDRATFNACGVPALSALEYMSNDLFCDVSPTIAGETTSDPDCPVATWATTVPCFQSVDTPGRPTPYEYTPIDCENNDVLQVTNDGVWESSEEEDGGARSRFSEVGGSIDE